MPLDAGCLILDTDPMTLLLAILLAFAAPGPMPESWTATEDEAILELSRLGRALRRIALREASPPGRAMALPLRPSRSQAERSSRPHFPDDWTPKRFSRPPPR
jgi:hypothetical protein